MEHLKIEHLVIKAIGYWCDDEDSFMKNFVNLSEVNVFFYNLLRSNECKQYLKNYYSSITQNEVDEKLTSQQLLKKISNKKFAIMKYMCNFEKYHEQKLLTLQIEKSKIEREITKLEYRKKISKLKLDKIFELKPNQIRSYLNIKNSNNV